MFRRLLARAAFGLAVFGAAALLLSSSAQAQTAAPKHSAPHSAQISDVGLIIFPVQSLAVRPPGFKVSAGQALAIAKTSPKLLAIHRRHHPLHYSVYLWIGSHYEIYFSFHGKVVADTLVQANGTLGPTYTGAPIFGVYARGHYGQIFDSPWVWLSFGLMFLLPIVFLRRRSWLDVLDLGVLLSFGISYAFFDHLHVEAGVWLAYPPLLYLLVRMLIRGRAPGRPGRAFGTRLPTWLLAVGLLALIAGRIFLTLEPRQVMDVGDASVIGAFKILHGQPIYYSSVGHGDTYGPIAYLAYAPFELIWPGTAWNSYLPAARAATITFDLLTIAGLIGVGMRRRSRRQGVNLGLTLAWLWAACPFSVLGLTKSTNDGLVALLVVLVMLVLTSPFKRGFLLGLAAAAKFFPAILLPLIVVGRRTEGKMGQRTALAGFVVAAGASVALFLPPGGLLEMYRHTIGFQLTRPDIFSPWALHPGLAPIKVAVEIAGAFLALGVARWPAGPRSTAQVAALAGALIIAVQLPALHWFYLYIVWFLPLVLIAVLVPEPAQAEDPAGALSGVAEPVELESGPELVPA